jgi:hypothetical protein
MLHNPWNKINNPGVAATILLAIFLSVMAWAWWSEGFLLP